MNEPWRPHCGGTGVGPLGGFVGGGGVATGGTLVTTGVVGAGGVAMGGAAIGGGGLEAPPVRVTPKPPGRPRATTGGGDWT
jgi:hypothetical protein